MSQRVLHLNHTSITLPWESQPQETYMGTAK